MNGVWNLDPIYKGFDDCAYTEDFARLKELAGQLSAFAANVADGEPAENLKKGIGMLEEVSALANKLAVYAMLRQSADARDQEAGSQLGRIMALISDTAAPEAAFKEWAAKLPNLMELAAEEPELKDYTYLLEKMGKSSRYLLGAKGEEIMAKMSLSGGSAWSDLQGYLTSTVPVTYRGETTNLSAIRNLAYDPDPQVRKDAYDAELACYGRIRDAVAFALNSIKLETISDCQLRGYASPLARTLENDGVTREILDAMFEAIDECAPKFWQYLKAKAKALGHEKGLPWYDLFAPMGKSSTKFTAESAREYLVGLFAGFDQELADMVAKAFDEEWIDFYPRDG